MANEEIFRLIDEVGDAYVAAFSKFKISQNNNFRKELETLCSGVDDSLIVVAQNSRKIKEIIEGGKANSVFVKENYASLDS